jgi:hypothetical protein
MVALFRREGHMAILDVLREVNFGQRVAEEEGEKLAAYFVETDYWRSLFADHVDVVYGPKGAGKSALYLLLIERRDSLFDRDILVALAENPRGATAFKSLVIDPPATEREFVALWKLYLACLISSALEEYDVSNAYAVNLRTRLQNDGFRPRQRNLQSILLSAYEYVKKRMRGTAIEGTVNIDPTTQMPSGVSGKITFSEPTPSESQMGFASVDNLIEMGNLALKESQVTLWILLDRLDVAFSDSSVLEQNALRALFHVYLDLLGFKNLRLKIFLRTDIWRRITTSGFREASHITRQMTIDWNKNSLLNLVVRRALQNRSIIEYYNINRDEILASSKAQDSLFYRLYPDQVDIGTNKSNTFDWMLGRTKDGTGKNAPRELIHLLNSLRDVQVRRLEIGDPEPDSCRLFSRGVFKEALPEVSQTRLQQTIYAEYPNLREPIEKLRGEKTKQRVHSLAKIWNTSPEEALRTARSLNEIGLFETRGTREEPEYWVPFLYRDALDLVQGTAD